MRPCQGMVSAGTESKTCRTNAKTRRSTWRWSMTREQYSIWPADRELPLGWREAGKQGLKPEVLAWIEEVWTDMRPLSLRRRMEQRSARTARAIRAGMLRRVFTRCTPAALKDKTGTPHYGAPDLRLSSGASGGCRCASCGWTEASGRNAAPGEAPSDYRRGRSPGGTPAIRARRGGHRHSRCRGHSSVGRRPRRRGTSVAAAAAARTKIRMSIS